jgi:hypothetical protein
MSYVGLTKNTVEWRIWRHHQYAHKGLLGAALRKHGREAFDIETLADGLTYDQSQLLERYYIRVYGTMAPYGYNLHPGGKNGKPQFGETNPNHKLTASDVMEIRRLSSHGVTYLRLMGMFNLSSDKYVGQIVRGAVWS